MPLDLATLTTHTPTWVWAILALLVALGAAQLSPHDVPARRVWLAPAILGTLSLAGAVRSFPGAGELLTAAGWLAGATLGFGANRVLGLPRQVRANPDGSFRIGGSVAPLLLFLGVFMVRYTVNAALALSPSLANDRGVAAAAALAYGVTAGLLVARSRKIWSARRERDDVARPD